MWRKFGMGQQQPSIGNPTLIDTSIDDGYLETIEEVESIISRQSSVRHPSVLPDLPFRAVPPMNQQSLYERASSIYSQPPRKIPKEIPGPINQKDDDLYRSDTVRSEVSSLTIGSSIENDSRSSPLVSPISTSFPHVDAHTKQEQTFRSQLPRPVPSGTPADRPAPSYRKQVSAVATGKKQKTRGEDSFGEPTDSEAGKSASALPGVAPVEVQYPQLKERTRQILANLRDKDLAKKPVPGKAPAPVDNLDHPAYREPWKGASGRVALVEPVKNTPAARLEPLHIPQRNISRTHAISKEAARTQSPQSTVQPSSPEWKASSIRPIASQDSIKPVVPLKLGSNNSSRVVSPTTPMTAMLEQNNSLQSPFKSPQHTFLHTVCKSVTCPVGQDLVESPTDNEPLTPTTPTQANTSAHQTPMDNLLPPEPEEVDVSRFSWTTYTATEPGSPIQPTYDSSALPPLPSMPDPISLRKRPVPSYTHPTTYVNPNAAISNTSVVSRKPVPADRNRSASMLTTLSTGKSLPQCPPELEASDKISTLRARLDDLGRRKRNKNKIKGTLSEELRRNAVAYNVSKRKDVEAKLKNVDNEMDEIAQEEHEVGLLLHRAQKKKDREENNLEPTTLWIKRVTR